MRLTNGNEKRIAKKLETGDYVDGHVYLESARLQQLSKTLVSFLIGICIVLLMWQAMAWYVNEYMGIALKFPYPYESIAFVWDHLTADIPGTNRTIIEHTEASLYRLAIAFTFAAVFGLVLGSILGYLTNFYSVGIVPATVFQSIPGLAWVPISLLLFGIGDDAAIFIIFAVSSTVITINVAGGIRMVPQVYTRAAGMMGANKAVLFIKVLIPHAMIPILNGLRLGLGSAWRVLIAAEMLIGTGIGLGSSMEQLRYNLDYIGAFGCIVVICIIGLLIDKLLFAAIEKYLRHKLGMEEGY